MAHKNGSRVSDQIDRCVILAHMALEHVSANGIVGTLLAQRVILSLLLALSDMKALLIKKNKPHYDMTKKKADKKKSAKVKKQRMSIPVEYVIDVIKKAGSMSHTDLKMALSSTLSERTLYRHLKKLIADGTVVKKTSDGQIVYISP